jgi:putative ABC transport system permease protein
MLMAAMTRTTQFRFWLWLIRVIGVIVPRRLRVDWRQEWEAELEYRETQLTQWDRLDWGGKLSLIWHSLGAFADALWMQPRRMEDEMFQDLRYGVRMLLKHKGFTAVAALTLALGIGANTALFSVVNALLLRPLPFPQPELLVQVWEFDRQSGNQKFEVALPNLVDWRAQSQSFWRLAVYLHTSFSLIGADEPDQVSVLSVSPNYFKVIGVMPAQGRDLRDEDGLSAAPRIAVLSDGFWQRRFAADPQIIGQTIKLNNESCAIVGVMPAGFAFPDSEVEVWTPMRGDYAAASRAMHGYRAVGRLKPGVRLEQAQAEMDTIARRLEQQYAGTNTNVGVRLVPLQKELVGDEQPRLLMLFGAAFFVLLIACANVAGLLLAQATGRQKEMAIRAALGARRGRLVRQALIESALLALIGGALGALLAVWGVKALLALNPGGQASWVQFGIDRAALGFTLLLSLLVGIGFGLAPALQCSSPALNEALKEGSRGTAGRRSQRLRGALVVAEIALALALLAGGGLLIKSLWRLQQVDPGFNPERLLTMQLALPRTRYPEDGQRAQFFERMVEQVTALPGVKAAAVTSEAPFTGENSASSFQIVGRPPLPIGQTLDTGRRTVSANYFQTLGVRLARGRYFDHRDTAQAPRVAIINEAMARKFWPGEDSLGQRIRFNSSTQYEIIGLVSDVKHSRLQEETEPVAYTHHQQLPSRTMDLAVRADAIALRDSAGLIAGIRRAVREVDPEQPVYNIRTMEQRLSHSIASQRFIALLLSFFAALAMIQAALGICGVMSYAVTQRTHEFGIRMALGARASDVLGLVIRQGMKLALAGVAIGLMAALALTRLMKDMLYDVQPADPLTFAAISLLLAGVALAACYLPARRATKVDPLLTLRRE